MIKNSSAFSVFFILLSFVPLKAQDDIEETKKICLKTVFENISEVEQLCILASEVIDAITKENTTIIERYLLRYPLLKDYTFSHSFIIKDSEGKRITKTLRINLLIYAIALGKVESVKALMNSGIDCNQKINNILPFSFTDFITDQEIKKEMMQYLLKQGSFGCHPIDLMRLVNLINTHPDQLDKIKRLDEKTIHKKIFQEILYIIDQNLNILSFNITLLKSKEQKNNTIVSTFQIVNALKAAILSETPWLVDLIIALTKMFAPHFDPTHQKISETFNMIDYVSLTQNREILDLLLTENPPISLYLLFCNDWIKGSRSQNCFALYETQNNDTSEIYDIQRPYLSKKFIPYFDEHSPSNIAVKTPLSDKTKEVLFQLFDTIKNNDELYNDELDKDAQLALIKELLSQLEDKTLINTLLITEDTYLTDEGYNTEESYETLLSAAIDQRNLSMIQLLVESGANVNQYLIHNSLNILHYAAKTSTPEILTYLLNNEALITPQILRHLNNFKPEIKSCFSQKLQTPASYKRQRDESSENLKLALPRKRTCIEKTKEQISDDQ